MPNPIVTHHRNPETIEDFGGGAWREACPLPFYGIRKRCECGRKFWREDSYWRHWRSENDELVIAELRAKAGQS